MNRTLTNGGKITSCSLWCLVFYVRNQMQIY